jgi:hypothetical protein
VKVKWNEKEIHCISGKEFPKDLHIKFRFGQLSNNIIAPWNSDALNLTLDHKFLFRKEFLFYCPEILPFIFSDVSLLEFKKNILTEE